MSSWLIWLIVLLVTVAIEMMTTVLISIWFAFGAIFALITSLLGLSVSWQIAIFALISIFTLTFTKPFVEKKFFPKKNIVKTNVDALVDKEAIVTIEISNVEGTGEVLLDGNHWTARSETDQIIPVSSTVLVKRIEGVKVIVVPKVIREEKE